MERAFRLFANLHLLFHFGGEVERKPHPKEDCSLVVIKCVKSRRTPWRVGRLEGFLLQNQVFKRPNETLFEGDRHGNNT